MNIVVVLILVAIKTRLTTIHTVRKKEKFIELHILHKICNRIRNAYKLHISEILCILIRISGILMRKP
jgi:hypothetical protein